MKKHFTTVLLLSCFFAAHAQQAFLVFSRKHQTIEQFWPGSTIAFQQKDKQWQKGEITAVRKDSFYVRPKIITYHMFGADTLYLPIVGYSLSDVFAFPKKGVAIDYKNGAFRISRSGGHQHFYWIKSGWVFRVAGAGYAALNILNGLIKNDLSISGSKTALIIAAALLATGFILKKTYGLTRRCGKKYHLEIVQLGHTSSSTIN